MLIFDVVLDKCAEFWTKQYVHKNFKLHELQYWVWDKDSSLIVPPKGFPSNSFCCMEHVARPGGCPVYDVGRRPLACWRLWVRIPLGTWMSVSYQRCVLWGRVRCDGLITRLEECYRLWCVVVCDHLSYRGVVYHLYILYFKMSCVYCC